MRAAIFVLLASLANVGVGAPLVVKTAKKPSRPTATAIEPTTIVSKTARMAIESERVELDVRQPVEPAPSTDNEEPTPNVAAAPTLKKKTASPAVDLDNAPPPPPPFATMVAARVDELPMCRRGGPEGVGVAEVVFLPDGSAKVSLNEPYARTETGACVARRLMRDARPFDGAPVVVRLRFSL